MKRKILTALLATIMFLECLVCNNNITFAIEDNKQILLRVQKVF